MPSFAAAVASAEQQVKRNAGTVVQGCPAHSPTIPAGKVIALEATEDGRTRTSATDRRESEQLFLAELMEEADRVRAAGQRANDEEDDLLARAVTSRREGIQAGLLTDRLLSLATSTQKAVCELKRALLSLIDQIQAYADNHTPLCSNENIHAERKRMVWEVKRCTEEDEINKLLGAAAHRTLQHTCVLLQAQTQLEQDLLMLDHALLTKGGDGSSVMPQRRDRLASERTRLGDERRRAATRVANLTSEVKRQKLNLELLNKNKVDKENVLSSRLQAVYEKIPQPRTTRAKEGDPLPTSDAVAHEASSALKRLQNEYGRLQEEEERLMRKVELARNAQLQQLATLTHMKDLAVENKKVQRSVSLLYPLIEDLCKELGRKGKSN